MTGDPNREIKLGIDFDHFQKNNEIKRRKFSFSSFQFPACEECNSESSYLESKVKIYFERIFEKDFFQNTEIDQLLDWFDKVRTGLWLGSLILDKQIEVFNPKFYIKTRISKKDRCLFIYESEENDVKGIQFFGPNAPGFYYSPSCFTLRVNNIFFFSYSFDFLFSKNIGFWYPLEMGYNDNNRHTSLFITEGLKKITTPLINQDFLKASSYIYQPIILPDFLEHYKSDTYIQENCLDFKLGKGDIFYFDRSLHKIDNDTEFQLYSGTQNLHAPTFTRKIAMQTFQTLEEILKKKEYSIMNDTERSSLANDNRLELLQLHRIFIRNAKGHYK